MSQRHQSALRQRPGEHRRTPSTCVTLPTRTCEPQGTRGSLKLLSTAFPLPPEVLARGKSPCHSRGLLLPKGAGNQLQIWGSLRLPHPSSLPPGRNAGAQPLSGALPGDFQLLPPDPGAVPLAMLGEVPKIPPQEPFPAGSLAQPLPGPGPSPAPSPRPSSRREGRRQMELCRRRRLEGGK